jgi:hypothetical protein
MLPKKLADQLRLELAKPFYQEKCRKLLEMYQSVMFWQFGGCAHILGNQKWEFHNQIERIIGTIYNHNVNIKRGRLAFEDLLKL